MDESKWHVGEELNDEWQDKLNDAFSESMRNGDCHVPIFHHKVYDITDQDKAEGVPPVYVIYKNRKGHVYLRGDDENGVEILKNPNPSKLIAFFLNKHLRLPYFLDIDEDVYNPDLPEPMKACPFCGGKELDFIKRTHSWLFQCTIMCSNDDCLAAVIGSCEVDGTYEEALADAIKKWNGRA